MTSRLFVCLVCHTEPDVWDGGFTSIDHVLPPFLDRLESAKDSEDQSPRVAWCLTAQVMRHRPNVFRTLACAGHEIGVHSHFPGANGVLEHQQALNRDRLGRFDRWFPDLCALAVQMGLPPPRTHATWMFAYRDEITQTLAECEIGIDCSVCYGGAHHLEDGFLLADSRRRRSGKPYRLSEQDHCIEGESPVVELPVSGGLGDYWEAEGGRFTHFSPIASEQGQDRQLRLFRSRLDGLAPDEMDIFHVHFHLYEFLLPGGLSLERLARAKALLEAMGADDRVRFSTPAEAVDIWIDKKREETA
jgi:hypothetical protein